MVLTVIGSSEEVCKSAVARELFQLGFFGARFLYSLVGFGQPSHQFDLAGFVLKQCNLARYPRVDLLDFLLVNCGASSLHERVDLIEAVP